MKTGGGRQAELERRRREALKAVREMQRAAVEADLHRLSMGEIQEEIAAVRRLRGQ